MGDEMSSLTPKQKEAIEHCGNPLLILAGAGAGKTRVLVERVKFLVEVKKVHPSKIVLTTFTIKASEELRKKIQEIVPSHDISSMFIGTIHSYCDNLIKQYGGTKGIPLEYSVLDDVERFMFLSRNIRNIGLDRDELKLLKKPRNNGETIKDIIHFHDSISENLVDIPKLLTFIVDNKATILAKYKNPTKNAEIYDALMNLVNSYENYISLLNRNKFMDFSLLEKNAYYLLKDPDVLNNVHDNVEYVLIDEFQDISPLQWRIFSEIIKESRNITVVGDKNQSIYGFRGSNPNIFDKFKSEFTDSKEIDLNINFRSKSDIVDFGNQFMKGRKSIHIVPDRKENTKIYYIDEEYESDSTVKILELIKKLYAEKKITSYGDVALLFRSVKNHGKTFTRLLDTDYKDIPYSVSGGTNFLSNEEIRSLIFFLSYVYGIDDKKTELVSELTDYESFVDALNTILFSVESNTISILIANPTLDIKNILDPVILTTKGICKEDADVITKINKIRTNNLLKEPESIQDAFYDFLGVTNCVVDFENGKSALNKKMMFNIGYFSQIIQSYCNHYKKNNWERFLYVLRDLPENSNLESENDSFISDNPENLKLMTIHQAKGLEFPLVIIPSLVNKRFPNETKSRTLFDLPKSFFLYEPYDPMKEEENLFYVAATRARDGLILSKFQKYPTRSVKPSEFIGKIDHLITKINLLTDFEIDIKKGSGSDDGFHVIDYSSISTYVDCPERFNLRYIYGFEAEDIFTQKMGKIYHNAIAKINSFIKEKRSISNSDYRQIIEESWIKLKKDKSADDSMKFKVLKEIKRYHQNIQTDLKEVIAIEKPLGINFDNVRVRGRLDFLYLDKDDNIVLMDYKSRKLKEIEKTHVDLQLRAYALALDKEGCEVDRIVAYPVQEEKIKIAEGELPLHSSHKVDVEKSVSEFIGNVKAENFESSGTSSSFCAKCPYKMICSYDKTRSPCK